MKENNSNNSNKIPKTFRPESDTTASYDDTLRELRCHRELIGARHMEEFGERVSARLTTLGFSNFSFSRLKNKGDIRHPLNTLSVRMAERYSDPAIAEHDLLLQYATINTKPIYKSAIDRYVESSPFISETIIANRESRKVTESCGYNDFYDIPIRACNGNGNVMLAVTAKDLDIHQFYQLVEQNKEELQVLAQAIDHIGTRKFPTDFLGAAENRKIAINSRPLELLRVMAAENLTLNDAAKRLHISVSTANQHVAAARSALDANTNLTALYRAMKEGLID
jgi:DNA-binding CsgD family transcriptional regulator